MSKLYFRYGAMNSGKSTNLMQVAYNYEERGMKVLLINGSRLAGRHTKSAAVKANLALTAALFFV